MVTLEYANGIHLFDVHGGNVEHYWSAPTGWNNEVILGDVERIIDVFTHNGQLHVFCRCVDGKVLSRWYDPRQAGWITTPIGGPLADV